MSLNLIAYKSSILESGEVLIENSQNESVKSNSPDELMAFLNKSYEKSLKVVWDIDEFISPILQYLGTDICESLATPEQSYSEFMGDIRTLKILYRPHIFFLIDTNKVDKDGSIIEKRSVSYFYHLSQFFRDSPDVTDINELKAKAQELMNAFHAMRQYPSSLISPINVYEREVMRHWCFFPSLINIPKDMIEVADFAEQTLNRQWVEAIKIGHWNKDEIYSLDLQSAYGFATANLYDFRNAKFYKSDKIIPNAQWAWLKGRVTIFDDVKVSPIIYTTPEGMTISPTGTWDTILTLDELNFINKWHIGKFDLDYGYFLVFYSFIKPFEKPLNTLFTQRQISPLCKSIAKSQAAAVWGKFGEHHSDGTVGKYYSPLMASQVATKIRLRVGDFIYQNNLIDSVVHIGTDGILSEKYVAIPNEIKMGEWKLGEPNPAFVLSSGRVYTADKKPHGLTYDFIHKLIKDKPRSSYYQTVIQRRQTLSDSLEQNDLSKLGTMKDFPSSLDLAILKIETDRIFKDFPKTGSDLLSNKYSSIPMNIKE